MSGPGEEAGAGRVGAVGIDWGFSLQVPDHWFAPDLREPGAADHDAVGDAVDLLLVRFPDFEPARDRMVEAAGATLSHAVDNDALVAAVGFDGVHEDVVAMSMAAYGLFGAAPPDLEELAGLLRRPRPEDIMGREVTLVELPAGPAVRVHAMSEAAPEPDGSILVVEGVDHFVPVPGGRDMLLMTCTTPSVAVGDVLLPVFDEIAASLRFTPA